MNLVHRGWNSLEAMQWQFALAAELRGKLGWRLRD